MNLSFSDEGFFTVDGEEFYVHYTYEPATHGSRDRYGCPEEPDYAEDLTLDKVETSSGDVIEPAGSLLESLIETILSFLKADAEEHEVERHLDNLNH